MLSVRRKSLMGRTSRLRPKRLAEKLLKIRQALGLSQGRLIDHLQLSEVIYPGYISDYENEKREPSLQVLLAYARAAGICVDLLADDELDLPEQLPSVPNHRGR